MRSDTFSLCATDVKTGEAGEAGVAVASHALAVGSLVPFVKTGVGAVATAIPLMELGA